MLSPTRLCAQVVDYFGATPDLKVSGKEFVDPTNKPVTLHGVMDTPNDYFNGGRWGAGLGWPVYSNPNAVPACKEYFTKVFQAISNPANGTYCNLFRLHLDPAWTNDPNKQAMYGGGENDISRFSADRLRTYLESLYIPIAKDALAHGLYVIIRPPGVFPEDVKVGDAYNEYLMTVWDIVSQNEWVKSHPGQVMLELGNEPVRMDGLLADYFQPIVNKIRQNGFTGILLLPGTSYQADYRSYNTKAIKDDNFAYAVHCYPGWYGGWDANQTLANFISTFEAQVPIDKKPIVITEVDWSPMKKGAGHWNETHTQYTEGNFGTWGTGTTNSPAPNVAYKNTQNVGWGSRYKTLIDKHPNISWTLQGTTTYVDMDAYLKDGTVKPAFKDSMMVAGYADAKEACSETCFEWFYNYACGDRIPFGIPNVTPEQPVVAKGAAVGNAAYKEGHYEFYTSYYSSFEFSQYKGTDMKKCSELTIELGEATVGYRLDLEIVDKDGKANYVIGTEANGTRITNPTEAMKQTFDIQKLYAQYVGNGNTLGKIRLNTVVANEDANREGKYYFTLTKMYLDESELIARPGNKGTSLADVNMYKHTASNNYVFNNPENLGGWGNGAITRENGAYKIVISEKKNSWEGQFCMQSTYTNGKEYYLTLDIKGTVGGRTIGAAFQKSEGYVGCGTLPNIPVTTEWQTVTIKSTVEGVGADRLLLNYGDYLGTLYIDNIKVYTLDDKAELIDGPHVKFGEQLDGGGEAFSAYFNGNVDWNCYADLSRYSTMVIKGTGGKLRVMYNRPETGTCPEISASLASGEAVVDLSKYDRFTLNAIKVDWSNTATVNSIMLLGGGSTIDLADYYISGTGYRDQSVDDALEDEHATVIDLQEFTGKEDITFASANPNCILIYQDANNIGNRFDGRNLAKNLGNSYDTWSINLQDGHDFFSPISIATGGSASYSRDLNTNCFAATALPFELNVAALETVKIYALDNVEGESMKFSEVKADKIPAGTVILYYQKDGGMVTLSGKNIYPTVSGFNIQPVSGVTNWFTAQNYVEQTINDVALHSELKDYDVYVVENDRLVLVTKQLTLSPFRALFLHKKTGGETMPASYGINTPDSVATGIMDCQSGSAVTVKELYDVLGRRINEPVNGVNVIRMSDGSVRRVLVK